MGVAAATYVSVFGIYVMVSWDHYHVTVSLSLYAAADALAFVTFDVLS